MGKRLKRHKGNIFGRHEIYVDLLLSSKFKRVLKIVMLSSLALFLLLAGVGFFIAWYTDTMSLPGAPLPGQLFLDLTNPTFSSGYPAFSLRWWLEHLLVIVTNIVGIVLVNGVLISFVVNWLSSRREKMGRGEARYNHFKKGNFSVIIGGHNMSANLAAQLLSKPENEYVLIQTKRNAEMLRRELNAEISDRKLLEDVIIYAGDRTSWHELAELHLENANEVFILGENLILDGHDHDTLNMKCWHLINQNIKQVREDDQKTPCHVMFEYLSTFNAFQTTDLFLEHSSTFTFIPFSIYESWAQKMIVGDLKDDNSMFTPLDSYAGIGFDTRRRVHLVVVGMSKMGMALALETARSAHYPNFLNDNLGNPRTLITVIDTDARRELLYMEGQHPALFNVARWRFVEAPDELLPDSKLDIWNIYDSIEDINNKNNSRYPWHRPIEDSADGSPYCGGFLGKNIVDVDFEFIQGDVAMPAVRKYLSEACADSNSATTIAICLPKSPEAIAAALYLPADVYDNAQEIWVQQTETGALVETISSGLTGLDTSRYRKLRPFGMMDRCDYMRLDSALPKFVSYAYSCQYAGKPFYRQYLETPSVADMYAKAHADWLTISQGGGKSAIAKRWSNRYCANTFTTKIRSFGLNAKARKEVDNTTVLEQMSCVEHNRWFVEQLLAGFRPPTKEFVGRPLSSDERTALKSERIHPDMVSNEMLSPETREFDVAISRITTLAFSLAKELESK